MPKKDLNLIETLAALYESSVRTEVKLDAILNIQAHLVATANGTSDDEEFEHINKMIQNMMKTRLSDLGFVED